MPDFNWTWLLQKVEQPMFENRVDQILYPELKQTLIKNILIKKYLYTNSD